MLLRILGALLITILGLSPVLAAPSECVILLHGLARTSQSMTKLESALRENGYLVANIDYPSREHPIQTLAPEAVSRGLAECRTGNPEKIHFVTHSLGGILAPCVRVVVASNEAVKDESKIHSVVQTTSS